MARKLVLILILFFLAGFIFSYTALAGEPTTEELMKEIQALKARVSELETKLAHQQEKTVAIEGAVHGVERSLIEYKPGEGVKIEPAELVIGASGTFVLQGTPNANNAGAGEDSIFDGSWSTDIEIEKAFGNWGFAFLHLEGGQGNTIESELAVFSNVNRDAMESAARIDLTELWYEQYLFNNQMSLAGGKMDATILMDENAYAHDECTQFLGRMFRNSPVIEFPADNSLTLHTYICLEPIKFLEFNTGYFNAKADWEDIFDHGFYMAQANFKPAALFELDEGMWDGNYRFYWWINDRFHTKLVSQDETVFSDNKEINYGLGISCDQMLTDTFGVFGRYGWQRPDLIPAGTDSATPPATATIEHAWSAGAQMTGKYWWRENDVLAFAIGQVFPSKKYKDSGGGGSAEGHIEAYYKCQLNKCIAISPDIQLIWNPNGINKSSEGDEDAIFVYGVRGQIDF